MDIDEAVIVNHQDKPPADGSDAGFDTFLKILDSPSKKASSPP